MGYESKIYIMRKSTLTVEERAKKWEYGFEIARFTLGKVYGISRALDELPKIGDPRPYYKDSKCISIEAYENEKNEDFLFYRVKYVEGGRFLDLDYMVFSFTYCILKSEVFK